MLFRFRATKAQQKVRAENVGRDKALPHTKKVKSECEREIELPILQYRMLRRRRRKRGGGNQGLRARTGQSLRQDQDRGQELANQGGTF